MAIKILKRNKLLLDEKVVVGHLDDGMAVHLGVPILTYKKDILKSRYATTGYRSVYYFSHHPDYKKYKVSFCCFDILDRPMWWKDNCCVRRDHHTPKCDSTGLHALIDTGKVKYIP